MCVFPQWVTFVMCVVWFQEPNVSMIITDYWMPDMTGYELLKKVKVHTHNIQLSTATLSCSFQPWWQ
jgi:CheY-like chemotaxis protein